MGKWRRMKIVARFKNGTKRVEEFAKMDDFKDSLDSYYHSLKNGNTFYSIQQAPVSRKSWIYLLRREAKLFTFETQFPYCSLELSDSSNSEWSGNEVKFLSRYRRPEVENKE